MKLLIIGSGGREHALAWKLIQSPRVEKVFVAPGNAGTAHEHGLENIAITAIPALIDFAQSQKVAFTVVGPELPLADGIVDAFLDAGLKIFGPSRQAAQLEISKSFAKNFMQRHNIPTAAYSTFTNAQAAHEYIEQQGAPIVIKAAGLAAGKGVIVAPSLEKAHSAVDQILITKLFGEAGAEVIIEEFLQGTEVSFIVMCDGHHILPLATSQDHKRLFDGDTGPNTGGMGAYSPTPFISPGLHAQILREVIYPVVQGMTQEGVSYTGFLYAGLMITPNNQVKVLEFNCRMGDPETQPILMRLKSDLASLIEHALNGTLDQAETDWDRRVALGIVMAAGGYPENPQKGDSITGLSDLMTKQNTTNDFHIFHSGTALNSHDQQQFITAGGRVLCVTALGDNLKLAQQRAYELTKQIRYNNSYMRHDIGHNGIEFLHKP
ncbi:MAG: phosphoribosylamine--glycine ligase [Burkholderiales bacterium]|uniref:phosphoribosylamine--glycine ligase n=1 Tax=Nitrosomonas sp. TaxID=42353 RepID=UPI001DF331E4|nr:phosphoribosylamine--glycine ligase [Nitrosomonas sp.]MCB1949019.1 phosphoribosylamine--glycine ligase [Nitrosomonas sp.]MCP5243246.1 phosphoribosylamine--glycine ligase [Burkholderiales bacterium]